MIYEACMTDGQNRPGRQPAIDPFADFRARVEQVRKLRGWSQTVLGKKVGASQSLIAKIETGEKVRIEADLAAKLADALGVTIDMLHGREPLKLPENLESNADQPRASPPSGKIQEGLGGFLERHPEIERDKRLKWYLENQTFRTEPWVEKDDRFWQRQADFWRDYLAELDADRGASSGRPSRKS